MFMLLRGLSLLVLLVLTGCPAKTSGACKKDKDCLSGVCLFGKCQACSEDSDCQEGQSCVSNQCVDSDMASGAYGRSAACEQTGTVYFDFNVYDLKAKGVDKLVDIAACMRDNPKLEFVLAGNTDKRGTVEYNLVLGEKRAKAVSYYLKNSGINGSRLKTVTHGKEKLVNTGDTEEDHAQNRRTEITFVR
ncbi:MAG: OmpA family protein [Deltaproteobacteria bacterium]|nr:OmpA family protein [Deltaproteobacteria bacterium]